MGVDEGNLRHSTLSHLSGRRFLAGGCPLSVRRRQNVVRPPEVSKVAAVVKLHSSLAMKQTIAALSSMLPSRPIGIFERMQSTWRSAEGRLGKGCVNACRSRGY